MTITTSPLDFGRTEPVKPNRNARMAIVAFAAVLVTAGAIAAGVSAGDDDAAEPSSPARTTSEYTQYLVDTYQIPAATLSDSTNSDSYTQHLVDTYQIPAATLQG